MSISLLSPMFQSSPSPKTGRYWLQMLHTMSLKVPILTQSENWALSNAPNGDWQLYVPILTQSENWALSRGAKVEAISKLYVPILTQSENWALSLIIDSTFWGASGSNPHPVRKLGAIDSNNLKQAGGKVPILTQSENWALYRLSKIDRRLGFIVPILTQSENWAL